LVADALTPVGTTSIPHVHIHPLSDFVESKSNRPLPLAQGAANATNSFMATMQMLVDKYPDGYEGWERDNRDLLATLKEQTAELTSPSTSSL